MKTTKACAQRNGLHWVWTRCHTFSSYSFWANLLFQTVFFLILHFCRMYLYPAHRATWWFTVWPPEIVSIAVAMVLVESVWFETQYIPRNIPTDRRVLSCCGLICYISVLPISFKPTPLALSQSCDWTRSSVYHWKMRIKYHIKSW